MWLNTFGEPCGSLFVRRWNRPREVTSTKMVTRAPLILICFLICPLGLSAADIVTFSSGTITRHGVIYKPEGTGPFPALVYNHGSAAGMVSKEACDALGPVFVAHGWVFFGPYRRGQGLSASAGAFIGGQIDAAKQTGGISTGAAAMIRLLETDHLNDQLSALAWLRTQPFVEAHRVGRSRELVWWHRDRSRRGKRQLLQGGCFSGGAQSWAVAPELHSVMIRAVRNAKTPIFFFQATNDHDPAPSKALAAAMKQANQKYELKIYPSYGDSPRDGHAFGYFGAAAWANDVFGFLNEHCAKE